MAKKTTIKQRKIVDGHEKPRIKLVDGLGNELHLEVTYPYIVQENESGSWIVYSPHFKTVGYSRSTEKAAVDDFVASLRTFFDVHLSKGTLDKALVCFGWDTKE